MGACQVTHDKMWRGRYDAQQTGQIQMAQQVAHKPDQTGSWRFSTTPLSHHVITFSSISKEVGENDFFESFCRVSFEK